MIKLPRVSTALATIAGERIDGLIVFADGVYLAHRKRLVELVARLRLPGVHAMNGFVQAGGLIPYVLMTRRPIGAPARSWAGSSRERIRPCSRSSSRPASS